MSNISSYSFFFCFFLIRKPLHKDSVLPGVKKVCIGKHQHMLIFIILALGTLWQRAMRGV